jgi:hypothetical protein
MLLLLPAAAGEGEEGTPLRRRRLFTVDNKETQN